MNRQFLSNSISFTAFFLVHVIFFKNAVFMHTAFCFFYVGFFLRLPVDENPLIAMLTAFVMGLLIDLFYDSPGLHAMASVLMVFLRKQWLTILTPQGGYDSGSRPSLVQYGVLWYLLYALPLILMHHSVLFFTEAGGFRYFWTTAGKIMASVAYTLLTIVALEWIRPSKRI